MSLEEINATKLTLIVLLVFFVFGTLGFYASGKELTEDAAIFVFSLIVVIAVIFIANAVRARKGALLRDFAQQNMLQYKKSFWQTKVKGRLKGKEIELYYHFGRKNEPNRTVYKAKTDREAHTIFLSKEGLGSRLQKLFGAKEIETGNKEFDKAFMVRGKDVLEVKRALSDETQQKLVERKEDLYSFKYANKTVELQLLGTKRDKTKLKQGLSIVVEIAKGIDGEG